MRLKTDDQNALCIRKPILARYFGRQDTWFLPIILISGESLIPAVRYESFNGYCFFFSLTMNSAMLLTDRREYRASAWSAMRIP
jgi:hypothetical protein